MKTTRLQLWVNTANGGDRGQGSRPCIVEYEVRPMLSDSLYKVLSAKDAYKDIEYELEGDAGVLALNPDLDARIAASDPTQVTFAKKELGVDITKPKKIQKPIKRVIKQPSDQSEFSDMP